MEKIDIKSLSFTELEEKLKELSLPKFRAKQIYSWLRKGVESFDEMSNLPKSLREILYNIFDIRGVKIKKRLESSIDNTVKYLYELYADILRHTAVSAAGAFDILVCLIRATGTGTGNGIFLRTPPAHKLRILGTALGKVAGKSTIKEQHQRRQRHKIKKC